MAGVITRKPLVGFASGTIIGALGLMLLQSEGIGGSRSMVLLWMFRIAGAFMVFVGIGAYATACYGIWLSRDRK